MRPARVLPRASVTMEDTYWEGLYPPSTVLGPILSKTNSKVLGVASGLFLGVGLYAAQLNAGSFPVIHAE